MDYINEQITLKIIDTKNSKGVKRSIMMTRDYEFKLAVINQIIAELLSSVIYIT